MKLTECERWELSYLARQRRPIWGAHLKRGEPLDSLQMRRWLDLGLIRKIGSEGYSITDLGRAALEQEGK